MFSAMTLARRDALSPADIQHHLALCPPGCTCRCRACWVSEGRSYHVVAADAAMAKREARFKARAEGHPNAMGVSVLHVERIARGVYEVVLQVVQR
jgi:hypothetical protein